MRHQKTTPKPTTIPQTVTAPTKPVIVTPMPSAPRDRIMRLPEVMDRLGIRGKSTIYRWIKKNDFPAPLALGGGGSVGWLESQIDTYLASLQPVILPTAEQ